MRDQANDLRKLVRASGRAGKASGPQPPLVAVTGGKGGVGVSTIAVNLAVALAQSGRRTVLVDADFSGPDVAGMCGLEEGDSVADILAGRRTVHEVLLRGAGGIQILPGQSALGGLVDCSMAAQERLLGQLRGLGPHADVIVLDAGSGLSRVVCRFCKAADAVLMVATPDPASVMDAYAAIKMLAGGTDAPANPPRVCSFVNLAPNDLVANEVHQRLARSCRRFLGLEVAAAGTLLTDAAVAASAASQRPFLLDRGALPASERIERLAESLSLVGRARFRGLAA